MKKIILLLVIFILCEEYTFSQRDLEYKYLENGFSESDSLRPYTDGGLQLRSYENRFAGLNLQVSQFRFPEIKIGAVLGRGFLREQQSMQGVLNYHHFTSKKGHGISYTGRLISDGMIRMGVGLGYGFYWSRKENITLWNLEMILGFKNLWFLLHFNARDFNNWFANGNYYFLGLKKEWGISINYIFPLYEQKTNKIHYRLKYWKEKKNGPWIRSKSEPEKS